jgi:phytoene dehydrogenase-like protein
MADAVVIGAGPNGLVAANRLADAGWDVVVLEAQPDPGGAVRSAELTLPGFTHDRFSAFYPLAAASPHFRRLQLERHGLRWLRTPVVVADPAPDGSVALLSSDLEETCASLDAFAPGDGAAWRELSVWWRRVGPRLLHAVLDPFPPLRRGARLLGTLGGPRAALDFARFGVLPVRRLAQERFRGAGAARLLAGTALHADLSPEAPGSALYGMVLIGLGEQVGWPVPQGGAGRLTDALVARLQAAGGRVVCGERVDRVLVRGGRAVAVRCADGREVEARRAVLADVGAPQLYRSLLEPDAVPGRVLRALERFEYDAGTIKVDWALDGAIPGRTPPPRAPGPSTSPAGSTR